MQSTQYAGVKLKKRSKLYCGFTLGTMLLIELYFGNEKPTLDNVPTTFYHQVLDMYRKYKVAKLN